MIWDPPIFFSKPPFDSNHLSGDRFWGGLYRFTAVHRIFNLSISFHTCATPPYYSKLIYRYLDRTSNLRKNVNGIWMECEWLKDMKGIWSQIFYAMPRLSRLRQSISGSALVRRMQTDNQVPCRASILGIKQLHAYSILLHTRWFQALILLPSWLRNALSISKGYCSATSVIGNQAFQIWGNRALCWVHGLGPQARNCQAWNGRLSQFAETHRQHPSTRSWRLSLQHKEQLAPHLVPSRSGSKSNDILCISDLVDTGTVIIHNI